MVLSFGSPSFFPTIRGAKSLVSTPRPLWFLTYSTSSTHCSHALRIPLKRRMICRLKMTVSCCMGMFLPSHFCATGHRIVPMPQRLDESCFSTSETCEEEGASVVRTFYLPPNPTPFVMNSLATARNQTQRGGFIRKKRLRVQKHEPKLLSMSPHLQSFLMDWEIMPWRGLRLMVLVILITLVVIEATSIPSIC